MGSEKGLQESAIASKIFNFFKKTRSKAIKTKCYDFISGKCMAIHGILSIFVYMFKIKIWFCNNGTTCNFEKE